MSNIFEIMESKGDQKPPELRSDIDDTVSRITSAIVMYETNFNSDGTPKTKLGRRLFRKYCYGSESVGLSVKTRMRWWFRRLASKVFTFPMCDVCGNEINKIGIKINNCGQKSHFHSYCWNKWLKQQFEEEQ